MTAPLAALIQQDPEAADALDRIKTHPLQLFGEFQPQKTLGGQRTRTITVSPQETSIEEHIPPYDFAWRWTQNGGADPFTFFGDQFGQLTIDARSGNVSGLPERFVGAHIGVGCLVTTDRPISVQLSAELESKYAFLVWTAGIGGSATSEGGLETTLMQGSDLKEGENLRLWHRRVSGLREEAQDQTNFTRSTYPDRMGTRIEPGSYVFNVGIWAFTDYSTGLSRAAAQSIVQCNILQMNISEYDV